MDNIASETCMLESIVLLLFNKNVLNSYAWSGFLPFRTDYNLAIQILTAVLKTWVLVVELMETGADQVSALIFLLSLIFKDAESPVGVNWPVKLCLSDSFT